MSASFFKIEDTQLSARLSDSESWDILPENLAGPFIGKAVTKRVRNALGVDTKTALSIEKDSEHPQHTYYWDLVNNLTSNAITELEECLQSLKVQ